VVDIFSHDNSRYLKNSSAAVPCRHFFLLFDSVTPKTTVQKKSEIRGRDFAAFSRREPKTLRTAAYNSQRIRRTRVTSVDGLIRFNWKSQRSFWASITTNKSMIHTVRGPRRNNSRFAGGGPRLAYGRTAYPFFFYSVIPKTAV